MTSTSNKAAASTRRRTGVSQPALQASCDGTTARKASRNVPIKSAKSTPAGHTITMGGVSFQVADLLVLVEEHGGATVVKERKLWKSIAVLLGVDTKAVNNASTRLRMLHDSTVNRLNQAAAEPSECAGASNPKERAKTSKSGVKDKASAHARSRNGAGGERDAQTRAAGNWVQKVTGADGHEIVHSNTGRERQEKSRSHGARAHKAASKTQLKRTIDARVPLGAEQEEEEARRETSGAAGPHPAQHLVTSGRPADSAATVETKMNSKERAVLAKKLLRQRAASKAASDEQKMILEQQLDRLSGIANHGAEDLQHPCSALHPFLSDGVAPPGEGKTATPTPAPSGAQGKEQAEPWLGSPSAPPSATPRKKVGRAKKEKSGTVRGLQKGLRSVSSAVALPDEVQDEVKAIAHEEQLAQYMAEVGVPKKNLDKVLDSYPQLKHLSVIQNLRPTIKFLTQEVGVAPQMVRKVIVSFPQVLGLSVDDKLRPTVRYLMDEVGLPMDRLNKTIVTRPQILGCNVDKNLRPKLELLVEMAGIERQQLYLVISRAPHVLGYSPSNIARFLIFLRHEIGIERERVAKLLTTSPQLLGLSMENNIRPKIRFLEEEVGISREAMGQVIGSFPNILGYSVEENMRPKLEYLAKHILQVPMHKLGRPIEKCPQLLGYSLEKRIKPRFLLLKKRGLKLGLSRMLAPTDQEFRRILRIHDAEMEELQRSEEAAKRMIRAYMWRWSAPGASASWEDEEAGGGEVGDEWVDGHEGPSGALRTHVTQSKAAAPPTDRRTDRSSAAERMGVAFRGGSARNHRMVEEVRLDSQVAMPVMDCTLPYMSALYVWCLPHMPAIC